MCSIGTLNPKPLNPRSVLARIKKDVEAWMRERTPPESLLSNPGGPNRGLGFRGLAFRV